jgi:hypothetical protein
MARNFSGVFGLDETRRRWKVKNRLNSEGERRTEV